MFLPVSGLFLQSYIPSPSDPLSRHCAICRQINEFNLVCRQSSLLNTRRLDLIKCMDPVCEFYSGINYYPETQNQGKCWVKLQQERCNWNLDSNSTKTNYTKRQIAFPMKKDKKDFMLNRGVSLEYWILFRVLLTYILIQFGWWPWTRPLTHILIILYSWMALMYNSGGIYQSHSYF